LPTKWRLLLLAAALVFAQRGVALHALDHAMHDVAVAIQGKDHAPPLDHRKSECVAFSALGCAISGWAAVPIVPAAPLPAFSPAPTGTRLAARIVFDSRAPPPSA
jgi:hypothetical protein